MVLKNKFRQKASGPETVNVKTCGVPAARATLSTRNPVTGAPVPPGPNGPAGLSARVPVVPPAASRNGHARAKASTITRPVTTASAKGRAAKRDDVPAPWVSS